MITDGISARDVKVLYYQDDSADKVETFVNDWLDGNNYNTIYDIQFQRCNGFSAAIIYKQGLGPSGKPRRKRSIYL